MGHGCLDGLDAGGGGVFLGFGVVVEEVCRSMEVLASSWMTEGGLGNGKRNGLDGGGGCADNLSSGRDMVAGRWAPRA